MNRPFFSCICLTYGRVERLQEAVQSFLKQDYTGPKQLLIFNTFPDQQLLFEHPDVTIINCEHRPPALGAARNLAIAMASGTHLVTWDDDDLYLPCHLSNFARGFTEDDIDWAWLDRQFWLVKFNVQAVVAGTINVLSFTKRAWEATGGYPPNMNSGEDRVFMNALMKHKGVRVRLDDKDLSFMYGWGNGVYHISGKGEDGGMPMSGWERTRMELERRVRFGSEPTGPVKLQPQWKHNYADQVHDFIVLNSGKRIEKSDVCLVELGRFGDIINILPVAQHIHNTYKKPHLVVSKTFASLLEGVSYVEPVVVDFPNEDLKKGMRVAREKFRHVIQTQIWGRDYTQQRQCASYNRESWRMAGMQVQFDDPTYRPLFDRRSPEREAQLLEKVNPSGRPMILAVLKNSVSSPFKHGQRVLEEIQKAFSEQFVIVDLTTFHAERLYDLLGLIERADCVVTVDTAVLHLMAATNTPYVALVNEKPWLGSECRGNVAARIPYDKAAEQPGVVPEAVTLALGFPMRVEAKLRGSLPLVEAPKLRRLFHAVERHEERMEKETIRKRSAIKSWDAIYGPEVLPCHYWKYARDATQIGDKRQLPYLKDVLEAAMNQAWPDDIIFLTNDDNVLHPRLPEILRYHVAVYGACCSHRCEWSQFRFVRPDESPEAWTRGRSDHCGRDLFAFTKVWLKAHWDEIPDYILGASEWDIGMAMMIRAEKGIVTDWKNLYESIHPAELDPGYIGHIHHKPLWLARDNVASAPSQIHNRKALAEWMRRTGNILNFSWIPELRFAKS